MDAAAEMSDITKQIQLKIFIQVHVNENLVILVLAMYISIGK